MHSRMYLFFIFLANEVFTIPFTLRIKENLCDKIYKVWAVIVPYKLILGVEYLN